MLLMHPTKSNQYARFVAPIHLGNLPIQLGRNMRGTKDGRPLRVLASPYSHQSNPFQSLLYDSMKKHDVQVAAFSSRKLLRESWDVWHLHWPENTVYMGFLALLKFLATLKLARFKKTKIFWTAH